MTIQLTLRIFEFKSLCGFFINFITPIWQAYGRWFEITWRVERNRLLVYEIWGGPKIISKISREKCFISSFSLRTVLFLTTCRGEIILENRTEFWERELKMKTDLNFSTSYLMHKTKRTNVNFDIFHQVGMENENYEKWKLVDAVSRGLTL